MLHFRMLRQARLLSFVVTLRPKAGRASVLRLVPSSLQLRFDCEAALEIEVSIARVRLHLVWS